MFTALKYTYLDFSQEGFSWVWYGWTFDFLYYVNPKKIKNKSELSENNLSKSK